jgi:hypothetical protein
MSALVLNAVSVACRICDDPAIRCVRGVRVFSVCIEGWKGHGRWVGPGGRAAREGIGGAWSKLVVTVQFGVRVREVRGGQATLCGGAGLRVIGSHLKLGWNGP